jgi:hypothetical protein
MSLARWSGSPWRRALWRRRKSLVCGLLCTKPSTTTPHVCGRGGTTYPGVVGEPAAGCSPSIPPVGGWVRLGASSWPKIRRWDRRQCCWRISGPLGGPEIRWILPVGWCPSKRVVVIHYARPYTAQKASGGCVTAIYGSASKFAEDTCYEPAKLSQNPLLPASANPLVPPCTASIAIAAVITAVACTAISTAVTPFPLRDRVVCTCRLQFRHFRLFCLSAAAARRISDVVRFASPPLVSCSPLNPTSHCKATGRLLQGCCPSMSIFAAV